jgi:hypothetical protein
VLHVEGKKAMDEINMIMQTAKENKKMNKIINDDKKDFEKMVG